MATSHCSPSVRPMHDAPTPLVVIGGSARAFAVSAARAGRRVYAADLFDDLDLRAAATATACVRDLAGGYPSGLVAAARSFPAAAFCFLGALENHPDVIRAIARDRTLLGSPPASLAGVRDPWSLQRLVRHAELASPECHADPRGLPRDGSFLAKPVAGAGGRGIVPWQPTTPTPPHATVWQRRIVGTAWSASYIVSAAGSRLLGASRQLLGLPWCHARSFAYCGSIDEPLAGLPAAVRRQFTDLGAALAGCGLRGAVGADAVVDAAGVVWVVEVNPRPCASMELIERATGESIADAHGIDRPATVGQGGALRSTCHRRRRGLARPRGSLAGAVVRREPSGDRRHSGSRPHDPGGRAGVHAVRGGRHGGGGGRPAARAHHGGVGFPQPARRRGMAAGRDSKQYSMRYASSVVSW